MSFSLAGEQLPLTSFFKRQPRDSSRRASGSKRQVEEDDFVDEPPKKKGNEEPKNKLKKRVKRHSPTRPAARADQESSSSRRKSRNRKARDQASSGASAPHGGAPAATPEKEDVIDLTAPDHDSPPHKGRLLRNDTGVHASTPVQRASISARHSLPTPPPTDPLACPREFAPSRVSAHEDMYSIKIFSQPQNTPVPSFQKNREYTEYRYTRMPPASGSSPEPPHALGPYLPGDVAEPSTPVFSIAPCPSSPPPAVSQLHSDVPTEVGDPHSTYKIPALPIHGRNKTGSPPTTPERAAVAEKVRSLSPLAWEGSIPSSQSQELSIKAPLGRTNAGSSNTTRLSFQNPVRDSAGGEIVPTSQSQERDYAPELPSQPRNWGGWYDLVPSSRRLGQDLHSSMTEATELDRPSLELVPTSQSLIEKEMQLLLRPGSGRASTPVEGAATQRTSQENRSAGPSSQAVGNTVTPSDCVSAGRRREKGASAQQEDLGSETEPETDNELPVASQEWTDDPAAAFSHASAAASPVLASTSQVWAVSQNSSQPTEYSFERNMSPDGYTAPPPHPSNVAFESQSELGSSSQDVCLPPGIRDRLWAIDQGPP